MIRIKSDAGREALWEETAEETGDPYSVRSFLDAMEKTFDRAEEIGYEGPAETVLKDRRDAYVKEQLKKARGKVNG